MATKLEFPLFYLFFVKIYKLIIWVLKRSVSIRQIQLDRKKMIQTHSIELGLEEFSASNKIQEIINEPTLITRRVPVLTGYKHSRCQNSVENWLFPLWDLLLVQLFMRFIPRLILYVKNTLITRKNKNNNRDLKFVCCSKWVKAYRSNLYFSLKTFCWVEVTITTIFYIPQ